MNNRDIIHTEIKQLLFCRGALFTFALLMLLMLSNFCTNVIASFGKDAAEMYHPMKMLTTSYNQYMGRGQFFSLYTLFFPIIVSFPAGLSVARDRRTGADEVIISRIGRKRYIRNRFTAVFIVTVIVFTLPFLIEILLNYISFPLYATRDYYQFGMYNREMLKITNQYFLKEIYYFSPYLYALLWTLVWGVFAGILACFTCAVSCHIKFRYSVFYIIPVFLLLFFTTFMHDYRWYLYVASFSDWPDRSPLVFLSAVVILIVLTLLSAAFEIKKDCIR